MYVERNYYPEWFIADLYREEDKQRAIEGKLKKSEKVCFCCSRKHIFIKMVSNYISKEGVRKSNCPICNKINKQTDRRYPQWFIDELVSDEDKQRATEGSLPSTVRVMIKCPKCGYIYETKVGTHISLATMEQRRGCKECAREKHRQDMLNYTHNNYDKVCETNRKNVEAQKEYYKKHPEKLQERGEKHSKYLKEHPEKARIIVSNFNKWKENNPDKYKDLLEDRKSKFKDLDFLKVWGEKIKEAKKNKPEGEKRRVEKYKELCKTTNLRERLSEAQKKFCSEHPEIPKRVGKKVSQWYKDNPEKVKTKNLNHSIYLQNHPEIRKSISNKLKEYYKDKEWKDKKFYKRSLSSSKHRVENFTDSFLEKLESIVHPEDYSKIISGEVTSMSKVRVKCPICGFYFTHSVHSFASFTQNILKTIPSCEQCRAKVFSSKPENDIKNYISSFYSGEVIENTRSVIKGELDLYYPEKKIAIEYNGAYWHSDMIKPKRFHFYKFYQCKKKGIRLLSIFSQDWEYKKEKVLSIIRSLFEKPEIVYARKCIVKEISKETRKKFFEAYHFDGDSKQSLYSYGLFYNEDLLAVMSFGKLRGNNHKKIFDGYYELTRLAFKYNYRVIGGVSKLFSFFLKERKPNYIISYSDNDYFSGDIYPKLEFSFVSYGDDTLDYQWVKYKSVLNRYSCMPHILLKKYPQYKEVAIKGSVEDYIMRDLGYNKVYRCGNSKWIWEK